MNIKTDVFVTDPRPFEAFFANGLGGEHFFGLPMLGLDMSYVVRPSIK